VVREFATAVPDAVHVGHKRAYALGRRHEGLQCNCGAASVQLFTDCLNHHDVATADEPYRRLVMQGEQKVSPAAQ
jgi:hypothetical protein